MKIQSAIDTLSLECSNQHTKATSKLVTALKAEENEFQKYKETHTAATKQNYYSQFHTSIIYHQFLIDYLQKIIDKLKIGIPYSEVFYMLKQERAELALRLKQDMTDIENYLAEPNRYLLQVIHELSTTENTVILDSGLKHVNKKYTSSEAEGKVVDELYKELDKQADENPYAILGCHAKI